VARAAPTLSLLALALAGCPDRPIDRAHALEREGKLEEAARLYVAIVKEDAANLEAWDQAIDLWCRKIVHVGQCISVLDLELDRLGNLTRHKDALAEVLEKRARARLEQGLIDPALEDLTRARKASPLRSSLYVAEARAFGMRGQRKEAVEALEQAKALDPKNQEADELAASLPGEDDEPFGGSRELQGAREVRPRSEP
jgi:tetratricopeptide (TPR) repeat protein